jgi:ferredoxin-NADP reductase/DMSO/TMAO reductase YedYZ heme-binding membrane subunit
MPFARFGLIVNATVPLALLLWDALHHNLGADPVNFAIHTTGFIALTFLLLSLLVTPLRSVTGFSWLIQFRRSLGLYAFYYATAHLAIYFWFDRGHRIGSTFYEITHRLYLIIGTTALLLMVPLAATSFNRAVRALGGKKWKALHRLAYVSAILGCVHYYMQVKADVRKPLIMGGILAVLLGYRFVMALKRRTAAPAVQAVAGKSRFWKGNLRVGAMFKETDGVRTFRLMPESGGEIPFAFSAGQFINLSLVIDGKKVGRSYTIASPPTRGAYIELSIKREEKGHVSRYLHEMLMTGQAISVSGPAGRFTFDGKEKRLLLLAGGVGITPVMSILRDLMDRAWDGEIDLVFSVRTREEIIFADELRYLAARHPNVHVHITVTRESDTNWTGTRGRITAEMLRKFVPDFTNRLAFICGPTAMAEAAREELVSAGVPSSRIKLESFTPAAAVAMDDGVSPEEEMPAGDLPTVTFAQSSRSAPLPARKSILEVAESVGVEIDSDCRSGICGRCRTKLLSGQVSMAVQDALSDADIAEGYVLACQAHAKAPVTVEA